MVCFSCGLAAREWKRGDIPLLVHCRTSPDCQFIKGIIKGAPNSAPAPTPVLKTPMPGATNKPNFADLQIRLKSFEKLSPAFTIPRQTLAETGLFLLRLPGVMKCHSCDVVLQDWVEGDTAVEKHRGARPDCPFLAEWFPADVPYSHPPHTLTESQPPSLTGPLSLSHTSTSAYHSMTQPSLLSPANAQATSSCFTLQSSDQSSMEITHTSSPHSSISAGETWVSQPHGQASPQPLQSVASAAPHQVIL